MAIVSVDETYPRASQTRSDERTYTRMYNVLSDVQDESELIIRQATGLPKRGQVHPVDTAAVCTDVNCTQDTDAPQLWHCDVTYSTRVPTNATTNPLLRPAQYSYDTATENVNVGLAYKFLNGSGNYTGIRYRRSPLDELDSDNRWVPVRTSAGEIFDPGLQETVYYPVLHVTRNEQSWTSLSAQQYVGSINSHEYNGYAPYTMLMVDINAKLTRENFNDIEYVFWEVNYTIQIKEDTWDHILVDNGARAINYDLDHMPVYLQGDDTTTALVTQGEINDRLPTVALLDANMRSIRCSLNGNGELQTRPNSLPLVEFYRVYRTKRERDFRLLNLF